MKMTEAGKLYLRDYYILNEAKRDMDSYLNDIFDRLETLFQQKTTEINNNAYTWAYWRNKSTDGMIQFYVTPNEKIPNLRTGKSDIYLMVQDVRNTSELINAETVKIGMFANKTNKALIQAFCLINQEFNRSDKLKSQFFDIKLENSVRDSEDIMEILLSDFLMVNAALDQLKG